MRVNIKQKFINVLPVTFLNHEECAIIKMFALAYNYKFQKKRTQCVLHRSK